MPGNGKKTTHGNGNAPHGGNKTIHMDPRVLDIILKNHGQGHGDTKTHPHGKKTNRNAPRSDEKTEEMWTKEKTNHMDHLEKFFGFVKQQTGWDMEGILRNDNAKSAKLDIETNFTFDALNTHLKSKQSNYEMMDGEDKIVQKLLFNAMLNLEMRAHFLVYLIVLKTNVPDFLRHRILNVRKDVDENDKEIGKMYCTHMSLGKSFYHTLGSLRYFLREGNQDYTKLSGKFHGIVEMWKEEKEYKLSEMIDITVCDRKFFGRHKHVKTELSEEGERHHEERQDQYPSGDFHERQETEERSRAPSGVYQSRFANKGRDTKSGYLGRYRN